MHHAPSVVLLRCFSCRADEGLHKACVEDAQELCKGVKHGGGQIQACLVGGTVTPWCTVCCLKHQACPTTAILAGCMASLPVL